MNLFISRTPFRISFFGGGSDYPSWYKENGGAVLSTAINRYCYLFCRYQPTFFEKKHRVVWSHIEVVDTIGEILHPAVREGLKYLNFGNERGVEILHQGDLPARTGIGSSSSFSVGLINALSALKGQELSKSELAEKAIYLEREVLKETGGVQDQYAAAYGGFNKIVFTGEGVKVLPVNVSKTTLNTLCKNLVLVYTGSSRFSSDVSKTIMDNMEAKEKYLRLMVEQVEKGENLLKTGNLDDFGNLLGEGWRLKKELSGHMTTSEIDDIYEQGLQAGALGGKLIGGGNSGFVLFYIPHQKRSAFNDAMRKFMRVPFGIDWEGSKLIYQETQQQNQDHLAVVNGF